jgi:glycogen debranching enzyme
MTLPNTSSLYNIAYSSLLSMVNEEGFNASSREEVYGCLFGRDSAITILQILTAHAKKPVPALLDLSKQTLQTLLSLQGRQHNIESGEEPGKFIHEYRKDKYDHLLGLSKPWFVYPDGVLRNYDSLDSTPLILIALYKYCKTTNDNQFLLASLPQVETALNWIITYGDRDKDSFIEYELPFSRQFGGLPVQSWTDSPESLLDDKNTFPLYPIAPVEAQAYAWLAFRLWGDFYQTHYPRFGKKLLSYAKKIKRQFNKQFIIKDNGVMYAAQALDGRKNKIATITANPMLCLWAAYEKNGTYESIIEEKYISQFVSRAFMPDLFEKDAGMRTMSNLSKTFNPGVDSYHNGSFWPMLNGLIIEGLQNFGFKKESNQLTEASLTPIKHFGTPIELYIKNGETFLEFKAPNGQIGCKFQAWSAAALLHITA